TAGTTLVKENCSPSNFFAFNTILLFTGNTASSGNELWKTDGTEAGTVMVKEIYPGTYYSGYYYGSPTYPVAGSDPGNFVLADGFVYFTASTYKYSFFGSTSDNSVYTDNRELWRTDGTEEGTYRVKDIFPGNEGSMPSELTMLNGTLYFT